MALSTAARSFALRAIQRRSLSSSPHGSFPRPVAGECAGTGSPPHGHRLLSLCHYRTFVRLCKAFSLLTNRKFVVYSSYQLNHLSSRRGETPPPAVTVRKRYFFIARTGEIPVPTVTVRMREDVLRAIYHAIFTLFCVMHLGRLVLSGEMTKRSVFLCPNPM